MKTDIYVEYEHRQTNTKQLVDQVKEIWKSEERLVKDIMNLEIYYKPHENTCYYVVNEEVTGKFVVHM